MLRNFLYLNEDTLNDYVSVLEDGLRSTTTRTNEDASERSGAADAKVVSGQLSSSRSHAEATESADTGPARFNRLLQLARANEEASGWVDVVTLDDLAEAGMGAFVDFECELEVPDMARIAGSGELAKFADQMGQMASVARFFGDKDMDLPSANEIEAMSTFDRLLKSDDLIAVGEDETSEWRVGTALNRQHLRPGIADISGDLRVAGKVGKLIRPGEYRLLLGLPGMSLLPRAERRAMEKKRPKEDEMDMYLAGPARMIEVLAIYR